MGVPGYLIRLVGVTGLLRNGAHGALLCRIRLNLRRGDGRR